MVCTFSGETGFAGSEWSLILEPSVFIHKPSQAQLVADSLKARIRLTKIATDKMDLYGQLCYTYAGTTGDIVLAHN